MLVEKVGVQTQTSSKDPHNLYLRRVVVGPNLYFRADGTRDKEPLHYWGYDKYIYEIFMLSLLSQQWDPEQ